MGFFFSLFICESIVSLAFLSLFYLLPITPVLLIAYVCNQLASLEFMVAAILSSGKNSGKPQSLVLPVLSFKFLLLSFVLSGIAVVLEVLNIWEIPCLLLIVLNILLHGYYLVKATVTFSGASYISGVEKKAASQLAGFDHILGEARQCLALVSEDDDRKQLKKLCEAIQYSDHVGRPETVEDEQKIKTLLNDLKQSISTKDGKMDEICRKLMQAVQMRNEKLRMLKMEGR